jgi:hypothetical protein
MSARKNVWIRGENIMNEIMTDGLSTEDQAFVNYLAAVLAPIFDKYDADHPGVPGRFGIAHLKHLKDRIPDPTQKLWLNTATANPDVRQEQVVTAASVAAGCNCCSWVWVTTPPPPHFVCIKVCC